MKKLIIHRMLEQYDNNNISRFSTIVWSGYRYLALKKNRNSILSVNRGKMSTIGSVEMIFPLTGEHLKKLLSDTDKILKKAKQIVNLYNKFIKTIIIFVDENHYDNKPILVNKFWDKLYELVSHIPKNDYKVDESVYRDEFNDDDCKKYLDKLIKEDEIQENKEITKNMDNIICNTFKMIFDLQKECNELINFDDNLKKNIINENQYKNMIKYVTKNTKMKVQEAQIKTLYYNLVEEVLSVINDMKTDIFEDKLKEIQEKEFFKLLNSHTQAQ